jgi:hypothetical protein
MHPTFSDTPGASACARRVEAQPGPAPCRKPSLGWLTCCSSLIPEHSPSHHLSYRGAVETADTIHSGYCLMMPMLASMPTYCDSDSHTHALQSHAGKYDSCHIKEHSNKPLKLDAP